MKVKSECYSCAGEVVSLHDHFGRLGSVRTSVVSPEASRPAAHTDRSSAANKHKRSGHRAVYSSVSVVFLLATVERECFQSKNICAEGQGCE